MSSADCDASSLQTGTSVSSSSNSVNIWCDVERRCETVSKEASPRLTKSLRPHRGQFFSCEVRSAKPQREQIALSCNRQDASLGSTSNHNTTQELNNDFPMAT